MAHLAIGPFMKDLKVNMKENLDGSAGKKLSVFSGHDSTIGPLLNAFKIFDNKAYPILTSSSLPLEL
jgi:hypothetical protein